MKNNLAEIFSQDRSTIRSYNPATGDLIGEVPNADAAAVQAAIVRARHSFPDWRDKSLDARLRYLSKLKEWLLDNSDELAELVSAEVGKPRIEAMSAEIAPGAYLIDYYIENCESLLEPKFIPTKLLKHRSCYEYRSAMGLVASITPWNFPLHLTLTAVVPALAVGNVVINKPSEFTPLVGVKIAEGFRDIGLPDGVYQCITGDGKTGAALLESKIDKVHFTGSVATGKKIAAACAANLVPCTLELGGKDAMIVCADADIERAARGAVWGGFTNSGQVCASIERVYVNEKVYSQFVEKVVEYSKELRQGADESFAVDVGAMCNTQQLNIVDKQVKAAIKAGAKALTGGKIAAGEAGLFYEATVLTEVTDDMDVMTQETFGPVIGIRAVSDDNEAIALANASEYGLTASVWTRSRKRAEGISIQLDTGNVTVNDHLTPTGIPELPWGGVKNSGIGRSMGAEGVLANTKAKIVVYDRISGKKEPHWFPYNIKGYQMFRNVTQVVFRRKMGDKLKGIAKIVTG